MKGLLAGSLSLAVGAWLAIGRAEEVEWRAAPASHQVVDEQPPPTPPQESAPAHSSPTLQRAEPIPASSVTDAQPASFLLLQARTRIATKNPGTTTASSLEPVLAKPIVDKKPTYCLVAEHGFGEEPPPVNPGRQFYARAELLMWWIKGQTAPPLVTAATPPNLGFLNGPTTQILYGNGVIGGQFLLGGRFTVGTWLNDCQTCGVDASYFFLGPRCDLFRVDTSQFPVLTRPIFAPNPELNREVGQIVSFPPGFMQNGQPTPDAAGSIAVVNSTFLWGADVNLRKNLCCEGGCCGGHRVDLYAGFRYLDLSEHIFIVENVVVGNNNQLQPPLPPGTRTMVTDFFGTHNQFYGFPIGIEAEWRRGRLFTMLRSSVAIGVTHQTLLIDGSQVVTPPGGPTTVFAGGLMALPGTNMGRFQRDAFSVVPELTWNIGFQIRPNWRAFVGYNFLYWNNVIRPANQIDRTVDVTRVPNFVPPGIFTPVNPPRPAVLFNRNDFWTQGLNLGMEIRW